MEPISFARGVPAPECLALEELADCAHAAIVRDGATALNYGPAGGYAPLREWIADRHRVEPERVVLTNGSLQGFRFLAELLSPIGTVIVEAPTYDRPLKILAELGAEVICVPLDEEPAVNGGVAFLYTIPTFQNPTGRTLPKDRRKRLAERARDGLLVLEDDPYGLVRFEGKPPPTVFELARGENVVYSSSFSKTIAPGLRVGYLVLPGALAEQVVAAATASYITPALLSQATVYEFLRRGSFEPNLERINGLLRERRDAMVGALDAICPRRPGTSPRAATSSGWSSRTGSRPRTCAPRTSRSFPAPTSSAGRAGRARSGSPSAPSRRPRSRKASAAWPQPSAPRSCSAARLRHAFGAVNRTDGLCPRVRRNDRSIQFSGSCERPDRRRRR